MGLFTVIQSDYFLKFDEKEGYGQKLFTKLKSWTCRTETFLNPTNKTNSGHFFVQ